MTSNGRVDIIIIIQRLDRIESKMDEQRRELAQAQALDEHRRDTEAAVLRRGGPIAQRLQSPRLYEQYFDTNLGRPVWWDGSRWVDASGQPV